MFLNRLKTIFCKRPPGNGKILVDLSMLKNIYCGLGQVALHAGRHLSERPDASNFIFLVPKAYVGFFGDKVSYHVFRFWHEFLPSLKGVAVTHLSNQSAKFKPSPDSKNILTIHDLNFLFEKKSYKHGKYLRPVKANIQQAKTIVYISNYSMRTVNEIIQIPPGVKQVVVYNGVEIDTKKAVKKPTFLAEGEFLFFIGEIQKKKNLETLIRFVKALPRPIKIVIAGNDGYSYAKTFRKKIKKEGVESWIVLPGIVSEDDKIYLYKHCKAFVFPSLYEGFGIPVIEAMRFGKPVFSSTSTSLPEVGGDKAFYWEHFDPDYMAQFFLEKMNWFEAHPHYAEELKTYSMRFTWESNIAQYIRLYEELKAPHLEKTQAQDM